jgi:hypothetical protein
MLISILACFLINKKTETLAQKLAFNNNEVTIQLFYKNIAPPLN